MAVEIGLLYADTNDWHPLTNGSSYRKFSPIICIKITQGTSWLDPKAAAQVREAEQNGISVLGYAFGVGADGIAQANFLLKNFPNKPGRMYMIDVERNPSGSSISDGQTQAFVNRINQVAPGKAWWYGNGWRNKPRGAHLIVASYGSAQPKNCQSWQYTDGQIGPYPRLAPGVGGGFCDMNKLLVPLWTWRQWAQMNGTYPGKPLRRGMTDYHVGEFANRLKQLKYTGFVVSNFFGVGKYWAVRRFQRDNKLPVDGVVGPVTWRKLWS